MTASILIVGDEILIGQVTDTNSGWMAQQLTAIGISVVRILTVTDQQQDIVNALNLAIHDTDLILMTGGLGPTKDDVTKMAIAEFMGVGMYFDQGVYDRIESMFKKLNRVLSPHHRNQCLMPEGVELIHNSMGTAPGMLFRKDRKRLISMPGVPFEMKAIMNEYVVPALKKLSDQQLFHFTIHTACTGETIIENKITHIVDTFPEYIKIAYLPSVSAVKLRLTGIGNTENLEGEVMSFANQIIETLGDIVYGFNETTLQAELQKLCIDKHLTTATAESCTGGAIAAKIVSISGSSAYFKGGIVAYSNAIKQNILHVDQATLETYGAVSEETVQAMVDGVIDLLAVDVAVAISGIAGPDGGTSEKPVGTIWICAGNKNDKVTFLLRNGKFRDKNIEAGTMYALDILRKFVMKL